MVAVSLSDVAVIVRVVSMVVLLWHRFQQANLGSLLPIDRHFLQMTSPIQDTIDVDDGGISYLQRLGCFALCS